VCCLDLNNTKDLATTLGHETSHAIDNQDPSIDTNPQNNASKADNEIYAQNYALVCICTKSENRRRSQGVACRCHQVIFFK
jgi:hypothetical protein